MEEIQIAERLRAIRLRLDKAFADDDDDAMQAVANELSALADELEKASAPDLDP